MKVFAKNRGNLLYKLISILLISASITAPIYNFFNVKPTRTDTFTENTVKSIAELEHLKKQELSEIKSSAEGLVSTPVYSAAAVTYAAAPANNITIAGRYIPMYYNDAIADVSPAAGVAYRYTRYNVVYGHNSYDVFGGLEGMMGAQFTVTENGVTSTYQISRIITRSKKSGFYAPAAGQIALVTCAPGVTPEAANSPESLRTVIYANKIS